MSTLVLEPVNGSPRVVYTLLCGQPVPYYVTVQRDGVTLTMRELADAFVRRTPLAEWIEELGRARRVLGLDGIGIARRLAKKGPDARAYLPYRVA